MMARMMSLPRAPVLASLLLAAFQGAHAQAPTPAPAASAATAAAPVASAPKPSALSAELFYQLLVGELAARGTDPGAGFSLMLDTAR
jgi:hypothetical protein